MSAAGAQTRALAAVARKREFSARSAAQLVLHDYLGICERIARGRFVYWSAPSPRVFSKSACQ
jgi:hypothetical protein